MFYIHQSFCFWNNLFITKSRLLLINSEVWCEQWSSSRHHGQWNSQIVLSNLVRKLPALHWQLRVCQVCFNFMLGYNYLTERWFWWQYFSCPEIIRISILINVRLLLRFKKRPPLYKNYYIFISFTDDHYSHLVSKAHKDLGLVIKRSLV